LATEDTKYHKSPGMFKSHPELIKAGCRTIRCEIHKLIIYVWNKEEWKQSIILPTCMKGDKTGCSNYRAI